MIIDTEILEKQIRKHYSTEFEKQAGMEWSEASLLIEEVERKQKRDIDAILRCEELFSKFD
jgi:hypothetical protein